MSDLYNVIKEIARERANEVLDATRDEQRRQKRQLFSLYNAIQDVFYFPKYKAEETTPSYDDLNTAEQNHLVACAFKDDFGGIALWVDALEQFGSIAEPLTNDTFIAILECDFGQSIGENGQLAALIYQLRAAARRATRHIVQKKIDEVYEDYLTDEEY